MAKFFSEDVVALRDDPRITGIVTSTWQDIDPILTIPDDWITHADVSSRILDECIDKGKPAENHVIVEFNAPFSGTAVVCRDALVLLDRGLCVGDVVKKNSSDHQSGTITNTHIKCKIQPVYTDLPYNGSRWPHRSEDNELWVPAHEVRYWDYREHDYVAFRGWIGQVIKIREEVAVRLQDGNVVRVKEPEELESTFWVGDYRRVNRRWLEGNTLVHNLHKVRQMLAETSDRDAMGVPPTFFPGLKVQTKKSNLRLGHWVIGSYNASTPPKGVVVETRVLEMDVDWITTNIFDPAMARSEPPDNIITTDELDELQMCNTSLPESPYGSRVMREIMPGDLCKLRDEPEAEVRYSETSGQGRFRRIPRTITQGFNMNVFRVVESQTEIDIQWQDGSESRLRSTEVVPYLNVDDHDLWPGEAVSIKGQEEIRDGLLHAKKLGVVQRVYAADRVADVRWYTNPDIACFKEDVPTLVPGGNCGDLSTEVSTVSVYEVIEFPALTRRRGDIVLLSPNLTTSNVSQIYNSVRPHSTNSASWLSSLNAAASILINGPVIATETSEGLPWVGEVVELGLDGYITVRLSALNTPRDVRVKADKVVMLVGVDEDEISVDSEDESMDDFESDSESVATIREEIEYEGGERLDNGDDSAWLTDGSDDEEPAPGPTDADGDIEMSNGSNGAEEATATSAASDALPPAASSSTEYQFNDYPSMPPQFLVLDEKPPEDHHFFKHSHSWNTPGALRRIRKEHKLLQSSLPRGIWVRTWADRLDLLRIMIIGPRGTPYALAPFVFDFALNDNYPKEPPEAYFHSWTNNMGKINPNLYEDGKVCLSVLGTWPGSEKTESWSAEHSSMLQVLVSLLGLVLVERPYYNEAGFENLVGTEDNLINEKIYSEKALVMAKGFVVHALRNQVAGLSDVINWVYRDKEGPRLLPWVIEEARKLRDRGPETGEEKLSRGILIVLERHTPALEAISGGS